MLEATQKNLEEARELALDDLAKSADVKDALYDVATVGLILLKRVRLISGAVERDGNWTQDRTIKGWGVFEVGPNGACIREVADGLKEHEAHEIVAAHNRGDEVYASASDWTALREAVQELHDENASHASTDPNHGSAGYVMALEWVMQTMDEWSAS